MSFRATHRNARIAPRKARLVADMIRGMNAAEALVASNSARSVLRGITRVFSRRDGKRRRAGCRFIPRSVRSPR